MLRGPLRVAFATTFLAMAVAGCGGGSKTVAGLPLWQRLLQSGELSDYDAQIQPPRMLTLAQFIPRAKPAFVQITASSARKELTAAGFKLATIANLLTMTTNSRVTSTVIWVGSHSQAQHLVDWDGADNLKPCPRTCNAEFKAVKVSGIPGARGAHRFNLPHTRPFEAYNILFADGPFVYDLLAFGAKQGAVNEKDLVAAAKAQYKRVKGSPLPRYLVRRPGIRQRPGR